MADSRTGTATRRDEHGGAANFPEQARLIVASRAGLVSDQTYIVWFAYVLGGWKALVSTDLPDDLYYEVTYNKAKDEIYLDTYQKKSNEVIR